MRYVKSESVGDVYKEETFEGTPEEIALLLHEMRTIKSTIGQLHVEVKADMTHVNKALEETLARIKREGIMK